MKSPCRLERSREFGVGCVSVLLWIGASGLMVGADSTVQLAWDPSPAGEVAGYVIVYGFESGRYLFTNQVGQATQATQATIPLHVPGATYYFAARAYNRDRVYSEPSNEVSYQPALTGKRPRTTQLALETVERTAGEPVPLTVRASGRANPTETRHAVGAPPRIQIFRSDSDGLELIWPSASGRRYQVVRLPDIRSPARTPASDAMDATGATMRWRTRIDPTSSGAFFQVQIAPPQR